MEEAIWEWPYYIVKQSLRPGLKEKNRLYKNESTIWQSKRLDREIPYVFNQNIFQESTAKQCFFFYPLKISFIDYILHLSCLEWESTLILTIVQKWTEASYITYNKLKK